MFTPGDPYSQKASIIDIATFFIKVQSKAIHLINPAKRFKQWDDERYLRLMYFMRFGKRLNLDNPRTFNEKLQWLKLHYDNPETARLVDKNAVKQWVMERIGPEHVIPTIGVYSKFDEIDLNKLPDTFVLKTTHDSGGVVLVRNKATMDQASARQKLERSLDRNYYYWAREPQYKRITPQIIAEPFMEDSATGQLKDYKFFCFNGEVKALFVASDRSSGHVKFDYFDHEYNWLNLRQAYPNSPSMPLKPLMLNQMRDIASALSAGLPHVRVDLYEVNGHIYFGEMTFFHFGGLQPFRPGKWDRIWGDWLTLPQPIQ